MKIWVYTLMAVLLVSLVSLIGVFTISLDRERLKRILSFLVSFAVGGLFGSTFIHLLPESYERLGMDIKTSLYILSGILIFFAVEKFLRWRHCHIPASEEHLHPVVTLSLVGDGVHNLIDGMVIGASFSVSTPLGLTTTLAVILHEIPQEIGDFGILLYGGLSVGKALIFNFLSALLAVAGAVLTLIIGPHIEGFSLSLLPIAAGGFLYIAGSDLIPELQHEASLTKSLWQAFFMILGIGLMAILVLLE